MKINLESTANKNQITIVRSQIKDSVDLKNFDAFLSQYKVIDFNDSSIAAAARVCCGGGSCCEYPPIICDISAR